MTANKNFKRRVRERALRTGESYTAALSHLRRMQARENLMGPMNWQRVDKPDFGYAVRIPETWDERPPNLKNSPWETARFGDRSDRRRILIVFRQPVKPGRTVSELAEVVQSSLASSGFTDFDIAERELGGLPGVLLRCARHDAGRTWAVREYFAVRDQVSFALGCGSSIPEEDDALFESIAEGFELVG